MKNPHNHGAICTTAEAASCEVRPGSSRMVHMGRSDAGDALIELALAASFLLVPILIGMVDLGRMYNASIEVNNAATAGASWGAESSSNYTNLTGIQNAATAEAANLTTMTATADYRVCTDSSGTPSGCKKNCLAAGTCPAGPNSIFVDVQTSVTLKEIMSSTSLTLYGNATMRAQ
jgi:Flp pilus assembly protein TadG